MVYYRGGKILSVQKITELVEIGFVLNLPFTALKNYIWNSAQYDKCTSLQGHMPPLHYSNIIVMYETVYIYLNCCSGY